MHWSYFSKPSYCLFLHFQRTNCKLTQTTKHSYTTYDIVLHFFCSAIDLNITTEPINISKWSPTFSSGKFLLSYKLRLQMTSTYCNLSVWVLSSENLCLSDYGSELWEVDSETFLGSDKLPAVTGHQNIIGKPPITDVVIIYWLLSKW